MSGPAAPPPPRALVTRSQHFSSQSAKLEHFKISIFFPYVIYGNMAYWENIVILQKIGFMFYFGSTPAQYIQS